jgi:hypothetical protein
MRRRRADALRGRERRIQTFARGPEGEDADTPELLLRRSMKMFQALRDAIVATAARAATLQRQSFRRGFDELTQNGFERIAPSSV